MFVDPSGRKVLLLLAVILALLFASLGVLALSDPTEARYADIALRMYQSGDYITPQVAVDGKVIPYWGKPPLHFWLTSASYSLFGVSEWSARFPSFLAGLFTVFLTWFFSRRLFGPWIAALSSVILASAPLFFFVYGASAVDATLSTTVTGAMVSFALAVESRDKSWGLLFFVFLALGMLTKGPIAVALVVLAVGLWLLVTLEWSPLRALPWKSGVLIFLLISAPWYILAELRTPGFLHYFFVNEHILRYLVHDYGDKYGSGHVYPPGASWLMLLALFFPWSGFVVYSWIRKWRAFRRAEKTDQRWYSYLMIWGIAPALFFTVSRQMLATYVLPGFAALSILVALELSRPKLYPYRKVAVTAALSMAVLYFVVILALHPLASEKFSTKHIIASVAADPELSDRPILFPFEEPYSAQFYEEMLLNRPHQFTVERREALVQQMLNSRSNAILVFRKKHWAQMDGGLQARLIPIYQSEYWVMCLATRISR